MPPSASHPLVHILRDKTPTQHTTSRYTLTLAVTVSAGLFWITRSPFLFTLLSHGHSVLPALSILHRFSISLPAIAIAYKIYTFFSVPPHLAHLPHVPLLPLLRSYLRGEPDSDRIENIILPFATKSTPSHPNGHGVVLIWALGRWMLHIVRSDLARGQADLAVLPDRSGFEKEAPPDGMLLWSFIGKDNIQMTNGNQFKKLARVVKQAIEGPMPIATFVELSKKLVKCLGKGGRIDADMWSQRISLDILGRTAFGYDFNSMEDMSFLDQYISIMVALASPPYIILPILEKIFPRPAVHRKIASVKALFESLIAQARAERDELKSNVDVNGIPTTDNQPFNGKLGRGHSRGMLDLLVAHDSLSDDEIRDNLITFFMAGHDTTAGALMSSLYYLAVHPAAQSRARAEAVACLGNATQAGDLKPLSVADLQGISYILACLREALRLNPPAVSGVPRACAFDSCLGEYFIPARTTLLVNIWAIQHNEHEWEAPSEFRPERWIVNTSDEDVHADDDSDKWNEIPRTEAMGKMPDKFTPFVNGPRQCPGRNFALFEMRVVLCMLLCDFEWSLPADSSHKNGVKNAFSPFALSSPKGLDLDFKRIKA